MSPNDQRGKAYWDAKHPRNDVTYNGRPLPIAPVATSFWSRLRGTASSGKRVAWDVRRFVFADDCLLRDIVAYVNLAPGTSDERAVACLRYVIKTITYTPDTVLGSPEYWLFPTETVALQRGDCEDGAILLASLMLHAGIDPWRVRVAAGQVVGGGHAYVTYYTVSNPRWIPLDWCYWADATLTCDQRPAVNELPNYYGGSQTWFSFNAYGSWAERSLEVEGRIA